MTPKQRYDADLAAGIIQADGDQSKCVDMLTILHRDVITWQAASQSWWHRFRPTSTPQGWYCYGSVGIGKTYLMDLFYETLPSYRKMRYHFHAFMAWTHAQLTQLIGEKNPLAQIAKSIKTTTDIVCFDEMMVHDIGDAMILGQLFAALFAEGIVLLITSNTAPNELYLNGLQRSQFLPAIDLIQRHCRLMHLRSTQDYRLLQLQHHGVYFHPLNADTENKMRNTFMSLTSFRGHLNQSVMILERTMLARGLSGEVIWFDFSVLCSKGRSQQDYLELVKDYHTLMLSDVPDIAPEDNERATLFIYLIDILYDAKVKMILSCAVPLDALYLTGIKSQDFKRTRSRLNEMQSDAYLHSRGYKNLSFTVTESSRKGDGEQ